MIRSKIKFYDDTAIESDALKESDVLNFAQVLNQIVQGRKTEAGFKFVINGGEEVIKKYKDVISVEILFD